MGARESPACSPQLGSGNEASRRAASPRGGLGTARGSCKGAGCPIERDGGACSAGASPVAIAASVRTAIGGNTPTLGRERRHAWQGTHATAHGFCVCCSSGATVGSACNKLTGWPLCCDADEMGEAERRTQQIHRTDVVHKKVSCPPNVQSLLL